MTTHNNTHSIQIILSLILLFSFQSPVFARTINVMDTGLNMLRGTIEIPDGWRLDADIATNATTGQYIRFKHDIIGSNDEMLRELPPVAYGITTGRSFQQTWQLIIDEAVGDFMDIESGGRLIQNGPIGMRTLKTLNINPEQLAAAQKGIFEVTVTGQKNNQPYTAILFFVAQAFDQQSGILFAGIIGSPTNRFDATMDTSFRIAQQTKLNPQYDAKRAGLIDQATQVSTMQSKQRLEYNQQQFNQQQQMMRNRSESFDRQNQKWLDNLREGP